MPYVWEEGRGQDRGNFRIGWEDPEAPDGIEGVLGQSKMDGKGDPPKDRDDWEWWAACKAILAIVPAPQRDVTGFYWETEKSVKGALRVVMEALNQDRPLPEWAQTALAQGWKPPKGWKA